MTFEMRKERAQLHGDLMNLLTNCKDDAQYFRRLTWALEFITSTIGNYDDLVTRGVFQRDLEEVPPTVEEKEDSRFPPSIFELNP